jgi:hypothetical protein
VAADHLLGVVQMALPDPRVLTCTRIEAGIFCKSWKLCSLAKQSNVF